VVRIRILLGVALGVAAGLLSNHFIPVDGIWSDLIIGVAVGVGFFVLVQTITGKGKITP
jgi:predicted small secreted protein